ncbi:MAG: DUF2007 domain-containing protein [Pseudomonadales bacterium]
MQKVYSHENLAILVSAKNLLELNDIDCFIKNEFHASGGHVGLDFVPLELWVKDSDNAKAAASILETQLTEPGELPGWACARCGEQNEGSFETCWKCQGEPARG